MFAEHLETLLTKSKVFDLGQPYYTGMPHHPNHPPFAYSLTKKHGIQIMEMLNLEELSKEHIYTFLFIALPLKIRGGVGSPIRPIAIA